MSTTSRAIRVWSALILIAAGTSLAAAQPAEAPPSEAPAPAPVLPPAITTPGAPPITITITNNNNDSTNNNNSNPVTTSTSIPVTTSTSTPVTTTVSTQATVAAAPASPGQFQRLTDRLPAGPAMYRWLLVGGVHHRGDDRRGMRAAVDLLGRGPWNLGIAATFVHDVDGDRDDHAGSGRVVAYVARTRKLGRVFLRGQLGFGLGGSREREDAATTVARETMSPTAVDDSDRRHGPVIEASLHVALPIRQHLGFFAGPTLAAARFDRDRDGDGHHRPDVNMVAGLMWRR